MSPDQRQSKSPSLPIKTRLAVAVLSAVTDFSRRSNGTVNRRLLSVLDPLASASSTPIRGVHTVDVTVDPTRPLWFRLFVPPPPSAADSPLPVIVFFHGGGFTFLSAASRAYDAVCRRLARKIPAVVASVNYRLAPEHKCPAPYLDGLDVLRFLDQNPSHPSLSASGADLSNCFLMGDSAGGNIAHNVAKLYASDEDHSYSRLSLSGMVLIQPYFGGEERTEAEMRLTSAPLVSIERTDWCWRAFLPEGESRDHEAVNVLGPRDEAGRRLVSSSGRGRFPKAAMVVVGGWDPLQDWQRRYAEALRGLGVEVKVLEYENAIHAFYVFPEVEEAGVFIEEVSGFLQSHVKNREN